jgi:hypothetical protein
MGKEQKTLKKCRLQVEPGKLDPKAKHLRHIQKEKKSRRTSPEPIEGKNMVDVRGLSGVKNICAQKIRENTHIDMQITK